MASASRNRTPTLAARPVATMMDIGVARPRAQGQAMMSTATALRTPNTQDGSGPKKPQTRRVLRDMPSTASTNQNDTVSAMRCMGARDRWALATSCTIWLSTVSAPTLSATITRLPEAFWVAPMTRSPTLLLTGIGSPVSIDSSTLDAP